MPIIGIASTVSSTPPVPEISGKKFGLNAKFKTDSYPALAGLTDVDHIPVLEIDRKYGEIILIIDVLYDNQYIDIFIENDSVSFTLSCTTPTATTLSASTRFIGTSLASRMERLKTIESLFSRTCGSDVKFYYRVGYTNNDKLVVHFGENSMPSDSCFCVNCVEDANGVLTSAVENFATLAVSSARVRNGISTAINDLMEVSVSQLTSLTSLQGSTKTCCNYVEGYDHTDNTPLVTNVTLNGVTSLAINVKFHDCGNATPEFFVTPSEGQPNLESIVLALSSPVYTFPTANERGATFTITPTGPTNTPPGSYSYDLYVKTSNSVYGVEESTTTKLKTFTLDVVPNLGACTCTDIEDLTTVIVEYTPIKANPTDVYNSVVVGGNTRTFNDFNLEFPNWYDDWYGTPYTPANYTSMADVILPVPGVGNVTYRHRQLTFSNCCATLDYTNFDISLIDSYHNDEISLQFLRGGLAIADGSLIDDYIALLNPDLSSFARPALIYITVASNTPIPGCYNYVFNIYCAETILPSLFLTELGEKDITEDDFLRQIHFYVKDCYGRKGTIYKTSFRPNLP